MGERSGIRVKETDTIWFIASPPFLRVKRHMATCVTRSGHHGHLRLTNLHDIVFFNGNVQTGDRGGLCGWADDATIRATKRFYLDAKIGEGG